MVNRMKTIGSKVPEALSERIEEYEDEHDLNTSQAVRQLVRAGLEAENTAHTVSLPVLLLWAGSLFLTAAYADAGGLIGPAGAVALLAGIALLNETIVNAVSHARAQLTSENDENAEPVTTE